MVLNGAKRNEYYLLVTGDLYFLAGHSYQDYGGYKASKICSGKSEGLFALSCRSKAVFLPDYPKLDKCVQYPTAEKKKLPSFLAYMKCQFRCFPIYSVLDTCGIEDVTGVNSMVYGTTHI